MSNIYPDCTCSQCREYQLTDNNPLPENGRVAELKEINETLFKDNKELQEKIKNLEDRLTSRECVNMIQQFDHDHGSEVRDMVNHPPHYTNHPSGVECIEITRHMTFNLGNVVKYLWRCEEKDSYLEDLKKAAWYLNDEIEMIEAERDQ